MDRASCNYHIATIFLFTKLEICLLSIAGSTRQNLSDVLLTLGPVFLVHSMRLALSLSYQCKFLSEGQDGANVKILYLKFR
jgi:hypothetical protein